MAGKKTGTVKETKGFSLNQFDSLTSEEGIWMTLKNPANRHEDLLNTSGNPMKVRLVGPDSPTYRKAKHEMLGRRMSSLKLNKDNVQNAMGDIAAKMLEDDKIDFMVAVSLDWDNFELTEGDVIKYDKEIAKKVFTDYPWICDQLDVFLGDRENFLGK